MIQIYTGDGKGKTTAALGQALRALGHGMNVNMIQFMKGRPCGELAVAKEYLPRFKVIMSGREDWVDRDSTEGIDLDMARQGFDLAKRIIDDGECHMLILDEINIAVDYGLLSLEEVLGFLRSCPRDTEIICTGRNAPPEMIDIADLVSEIREVKHHYRQGVPMRKGIEF